MSHLRDLAEYVAKAKSETATTQSPYEKNKQQMDTKNITVDSSLRESTTIFLVSTVVPRGRSHRRQTGRSWMSETLGTGVNETCAGPAHQEKMIHLDIYLCMQ
ncbi:unnamed protein product [Cylicostephanus goldi]|uniref:Uncharacterized protein n=1 Tax=Cylicostephanus goldi TaxID=71465 RepID=A0A3P7QGA7_CYLGO|nr:unnamed protein product [Cylicostephanus goldi]